MIQDIHKFVDFVTVLDVGAILDPYVQLSFIELSMSKQVCKEDVKSLDLEVKNIPGYGNVERRTCDFGSFQLSSEDLGITQKDLFNELKGVFGSGNVGAIIKRREIYHPIRGKFNELEGLDGAEIFTVKQVSRGNHAKMVNEQFGVPVLDPVEKTKEMILDKGVLKGTKLKLLSKMRSNQVSDGIYLDGDEPLQSQKDCYNLSVLLADKYNKDVATLSSLYSYQDFSNFNGQVYHLKKMAADVVL